MKPTTNVRGFKKAFPNRLITSDGLSDLSRAPEGNDWNRLGRVSGIKLRRDWPDSCVELLESWLDESGDLIIAACKQHGFVHPVKNQSKTSAHERASQQVLERNARNWIRIINWVTKQLNTVKDWIPSYERSGLLGYLKCRKKNTRRPNNDTLKDSFNNFFQKRGKLPDE